MFKVQLFTILLFYTLVHTIITNPNFKPQTTQLQSQKKLTVCRGTLNFSCNPPLTHSRVSLCSPCYDFDRIMHTTPAPPTSTALYMPELSRAAGLADTLLFSIPVGGRPTFFLGRLTE